MSKHKSPSMTLAQFGALKGVSRQAVRAAIERGDVPARATCWRKQGKRRVLTIVDVPLASASWTPPAEQALPEPAAEPSALTEASTMADANRLHAIARARKAQLDYDLAAKKVVPLDVLRIEVVTCIVTARTAFLNVGWKCMSKLGLTREQACGVGDVAHEILVNLSESLGRTVAKATDTKLSDVAADLDRRVHEAEAPINPITKGT